MEISTPYYIVYESAIRRNCELISSVARASGARIIMAFKANALWRSFDILRQYGVEASASSIWEMRLANEELGCLAHSYSPAYTEASIDEYITGSNHITFNSLNQYARFSPDVKRWNSRADVDHRVSMGLRVNPMIPVVATEIYNPCSPSSRFGITAEELAAGGLPKDIEGFHFHALCEGTAEDLSVVLKGVEQQFGLWLPRLKWINMGGGHLMTRDGYDVEGLIRLLKEFGTRYPNLEIILEPGSAWMWRTGDLVATVVDIIERKETKTLVTDVSFACHMPDCLEMPYVPEVAECCEGGKWEYRIGGCSCLSGDWVGSFFFNHEVRVGDRLTFRDMNHYTTVKTNMFNGVRHPDFLLCRNDGRIETLRHWEYSDYKSRMD